MFLVLYFKRTKYLIVNSERSVLDVWSVNNISYRWYLLALVFEVLRDFLNVVIILNDKLFLIFSCLILTAKYVYMLMKLVYINDQYHLSKLFQWLLVARRHESLFNFFPMHHLPKHFHFQSVKLVPYVAYNLSCFPPTQTQIIHILFSWKPLSLNGSGKTQVSHPVQKRDLIYCLVSIKSTSHFALSISTWFE